MRYLIFNITVLSALGYLFMASPDQSFTNWLGKTPQMFDAARSAGREAGTDIDPSETAGTALLEAIEPVVEEVLMPSKQPATGADVPKQAAPVQTAAEEAGDAENPPVTMRDIETMIRALMAAKEDQTSDQLDSEVVSVPSKQPPEVTAAEAPSQALPAEPDAPAQSASDSTPAPSPVTPGSGIVVAEAGEQTGSGPAPSASSEMSDADIAAAFSQLQKSTAPQPVATATAPATDIAVADDAAIGPAGGDPQAAVMAPSSPEASPQVAPPAFMSPGQRVDSLALMVEELQMMYLERSGG